MTVVKLITIVQGGRAKNKSTQPRGAFPNTYTREREKKPWIDCKEKTGEVLRIRQTFWSWNRRYDIYVRIRNMFKTRIFVL